MILSVSERCDIVALYSTWFFRRLEEGFVDVRNPFYPKQVSRIILTPEKMDAIIFCTKNPLPLLTHLDKLKDYRYLVQVTMTPYRQDIEPGIVDKKSIINGIINLSKEIGKERVFLRYDPILLNDDYTVDYHVEMFERLCKQTSPYVNRIIISFVDLKKNTLKNMKYLKLQPFDTISIHQLASHFGEIAKQYGLLLQTCAEDYDLSAYGITREGCRSAKIMYDLIGNIKGLKKGNAREHCSCMASADIGSYNSCSLFCKYCYANYDERAVKENQTKHNPNASLLIGELCDEDIIKIRK